MDRLDCLYSQNNLTRAAFHFLPLLSTIFGELLMANRRLILDDVIEISLISLALRVRKIPEPSSTWSNKTIECKYVGLVDNQISVSVKRRADESYLLYENITNKAI